MTESARPTPPQLELQPPSTLRELVDYVTEDLRAHEGDFTRPGFRALLVHRFGNYRMHQRRPYRIGLTMMYRVLAQYVRNHYGVEVPFSAKVGRRVVIEHQGGIVIHGCSVIGDDCVIRQGVTLGNRHMNEPFDAPVLGSRVNVGAGAKLLGRVHIGDDASIGANSVVLRDVPAGGTAVGVPARLLRESSAPSTQTKRSDVRESTSSLKVNDAHESDTTPRRISQIYDNGTSRKITEGHEHEGVANGKGKGKGKAARNP
jgi:serine O-acetyltransferase